LVRAGIITDDHRHPDLPAEAGAVTPAPMKPRKGPVIRLGDVQSDDTTAQPKRSAVLEGVRSPAEIRREKRRRRLMGLDG
jgi:hypothetical protein